MKLAHCFCLVIVVLVSFSSEVFSYRRENYSNGLVTSEEEEIQPNRIEEANNNFLCKSNGYFADVNYGCQFYHVCETTYNPFDKPSFVKHTFSCVNGTVFNQMSFTCTRYEDSIPCEASINYFYLNQRNGDPTAYFLTDEDIVKPMASKQSSSSQSTSASESANIHSDFLTRQPSPTMRNFDHQGDTLTKPVFQSNPTLSNSLGKSRMIQPQSQAIKLNQARNFYEDDSLMANSRVKKVKALKANISSFDLKQRAFQAGSGVNYINEETIKHDDEMKLPPTNTVNPYGWSQTSFKPNNLMENSINRYESISTQQLPDSSVRKAIEPAIQADSVEERDQTAAPFVYDSIEANHLSKDLNEPIEKNSNLENSFKNLETPSEFSKYFIQNKKAAKINQMFSEQNNFEKNSFPEKRSNYFKQDTIIRRNLTNPISETIMPSFQSATTSPLNSFQQPINQQMMNPLRFEDTGKQISPTFPPDNNRKYVVPNSIRILDTNKDERRPSNEKRYFKQTDHTSSIVRQTNFVDPPQATSNFDQSKSRFDMPPVSSKASLPASSSFRNLNTAHNNKPTQSQQENREDVPSYTSQYGDYKVVKQIKGQNLLIDPSLENDPARDNIIAQVLKMLSKYN